MRNRVMVILVVVIVVSLGLITPESSAAFVCAGMGDSSELPLALKRLRVSRLP
ncbi:MAG: hypothetical protein HY709_10600 [Candidatus Latescibacteria bacterium]|nr:hypothetical protein [Candidatus Latescibacterota bacterium]